MKQINVRGSKSPTLGTRPGMPRRAWLQGGPAPSGRAGLVVVVLGNSPRRRRMKPEGDSGSGVGGANNAMSVMPPADIWLRSSNLEMHRSTSGQTSCVAPPWAWHKGRGRIAWSRMLYENSRR